MDIKEPIEADEKIRLEEMLYKLKMNREHVALDVLKTKYKVNYEKLLAEIKRSALKILMPVATKLPEWISYQTQKESAKEIASLFNGIYESGNYAKKIGVALYQHYSIDEAMTIALEINRQYHVQLFEVFKQCDL